MMQTSVEDYLRLFCESLQGLSPEAMTLGGITWSTHDQRHLPIADSAPISLTTPALSLLQNALYHYAYARIFTGVLPLTEPPTATNTKATFIAHLAAANTSTPYWDEGWQVAEVAYSGEIIATKGTMARLVRPGEFLHLEGTGSRIQPGTPIRLFFASDSATAQSGFYFVFGETASPRFDSRKVIRYYWNLSPDGASTLVHSITTKLNRFQIPFRFKCANTREAYARRLDSALVYVNARFHHITAELMADVYHEVAPYIQPDTPLFTHQMVPGLAFAEDPANGDSFGMSRCRLVAEGLWQAYLTQEESVEARLRYIKTQFAAHSLRWEQPYLNPKPAYLYHFPSFYDN